jgi:hypothetical protein
VTIEQADDHLMGDGSRDSGRGNDSTQGMTHGRDGAAGTVLQPK